MTKVPLAVLIISPDAEKFRAELATLGSALAIEIALDATAAMARAGDAEVIIAMPYLLTQGLLDAAVRLRWLQVLTSGTDALARLRLDPGVVLSTGKGVHGPQMAELAFFFMLALLRDTPSARADRTARAWHPTAPSLLFGKQVTIVGVGAIAEAVALRAQAFGMTVVGVSGARTSAPGFDRIVPRPELRTVLADADFVVVLTPLTDHTTRLIDRAALAAMPPRARLINLSRGAVVDEPELCRALAEGRLAGAGLDVFDREPLPADSPLWSFDNVIITPHVGGRSEIYARQLGPLLRENVAQWLAGHMPSINRIGPGKI